MDSVMESTQFQYRPNARTGRDDAVQPRADVPVSPSEAASGRRSSRARLKLERRDRWSGAKRD